MSVHERDAVRRHPRLQRAPRIALATAKPGRAAAVSVRCLQPDDYDTIAGLIDEWSRGRFLSAAMPRSFFEHFANTSLVVLQDEHIAGVLVGFQSQTDADVAYIHFLAIAPRSRRCGLGRLLYERFFSLVSPLGCTQVQAIAPPVNSGLIAFHRQLEFDVIDAGGFACGIAVCPDYAGRGQHRVLFRKNLGGHD